MRVIAYTGGHNAPSSLPRLRQYIAPLQSRGIEITECSSRAGLYPPVQKWKRPLWGVWNILDHLPGVMRSGNYDLSLLQREMLSTFVTLEPFVKSPRVLDVDDAIWAHKRGGFARRLAKMCDHIICGNRFLAEQFSQWNAHVSILPTAIDINRFLPNPPENRKFRPVIGWLGLKNGFRYLYRIEGALRQILTRYPEVRLRIVSSEPPAFKHLPEDQVEFIPYSREREVLEFQSMTIGIMPLEDSIESRGKCSFKMLQYMACGLPVVVSPIGMNLEVLEKGDVGFGARSLSEWENSLETLLRNPDLASTLGKTGRAVVEKYYSLQVTVPSFAGILFSLVHGRNTPAVTGSFA